MALSRKRKIADARNRLTRLMHSWGRKTRKIGRLNARLARLGPTVNLRSSLFRKFTKMVGQMASLRAKELNIISKINAVEKEHRLLRKQKKLRRAAPAPSSRHVQAARSKKKKNAFWLFFLWLLLLAPAPKKARKRSGPRPG